MELIGKPKEDVEKAENKEEAKKMIRNAGVDSAGAFPFREGSFAMCHMLPAEVSRRYIKGISGVL